MTYPAATVARVRALARLGRTHAAIARATGVSRYTVRTWVAGDVPRAPTTCWRCDGEACPDPVAYVYLLGLYLGDGTISKAPGDKGVWKLRIFQDARYPALIADCACAMSRVLPNRVGTSQCVGCVDIHSYSKHWPCLFPQHGAGRKHERSIVLEAWQQELVDAHPTQLLRGLIHSDGCRVVNRIHRNGTTYEYPRYQFTNASADIRAVFTATCDALGVGWTRLGERNVAVSRRGDVAFLDAFIGPKS